MKHSAILAVLVSYLLGREKDCEMKAVLLLVSFGWSKMKYGA